MWGSRVPMEALSSLPSALATVDPRDADTLPRDLMNVEVSWSILSNFWSSRQAMNPQGSREKPKTSSAGPNPQAKAKIRAKAAPAGTK